MTKRTDPPVPEPSVGRPEENAECKPQLENVKSDGEISSPPKGRPESAETARALFDQIRYARDAEEAEGAYGEFEEWLLALVARLDTLSQERDLAVAHDTQPYPTAWAYEQACKALAAAREREQRLREAAQDVVDLYATAATAGPIDGAITDLKALLAEGQS